MKECGIKINKMEKEKKLGLMDQFIQEIIKWDKKMEKVNFNGKMEVVIKEVFKIMK